MKDEIIFTPFYSSFLELCKRDGLSPTEAAKRAGISSGAPTAWKKKGAIPRPEQLKKLCVLFQVSDHELLGYSAQKETPLISVDERRLSANLIERIYSLTPEEQSKVDAFVQGMIASRPDEASPPT